MENDNPVVDDVDPQPGDEIPLQPHEIPLPEDDEYSEEQLTDEYDSVFDDVSLYEDDVMLSDDDVILEVIEEVSEEEEELPEQGQPLLAAVAEEVEDPHKVAIEQIDLALAHLSNNSDRLKALEGHLYCMEKDPESSEDVNFEVDQSKVNELKALVARLENELHSIQVQHLQTQINALNVSAAITDKKLNENREQLALKERVLQDSGTLICSLSNALDDAKHETLSVQASLNIFKRRCHKAEKKSHADRKRVSCATARQEASLLEQQNLQTRVEELEAQIESMEAAQKETKDNKLSKEVVEEKVKVPMSDSTKTPDTVTPNEKKLLARLAVMEKGYHEMLQYTLVLELVNDKLNKYAERNQICQAQLKKLENYKSAAQKQINVQDMVIREVQHKLETLEGMLVIPVTPYIPADIAAAPAMEQPQQDFYPEQPMPMYPNVYNEIPVQTAPPNPHYEIPSSPEFVLRPCPKYVLPPPPRFVFAPFPGPPPTQPPTQAAAQPPAQPFIIHVDPNEKDSLNSDSAYGEVQTGTQGPTEEVQQPNLVPQGEAATSTKQVQEFADQAQPAAESSSAQAEVYDKSATAQPEPYNESATAQPQICDESATVPAPVYGESATAQPQICDQSATVQAPIYGESSTTQSIVYAQSPILRQVGNPPEQVQPLLPQPIPIPAPPMLLNHPTALFPPPGYVLPPFDQFCSYRPGSHSFLYKDVRENRRCRWCWCGLIPRNTVQCQVCNILVHNTCKKVVPFTCGYPDPIWNHYISLPVSHTEIPATQSYTMPNPCCWVIFHRERAVRRYVMLYGPNINIYGHVPGPYDMPLEIIPLQMCGLMPRLIVDLTNRFKVPNVDKCIAYQQMVTPNPNRRQGTTFILEFGNHWDRECFIDAISLFIATLVPPGPYDHFQNK